MKNIDEKVVKDFGTEWTKYDQSKFPEKESLKEFHRYFNIFPLNRNNSSAVATKIIFKGVIGARNRNVPKRIEQKIIRIKIRLD